VHLFVYGTLARPGVLERVLGHPHGGERLRAQLLDFERVVTPAYPYPFLRPKQGTRTDGLVILDLSAEDFQALDEYEDVETGLYQRVSVEADVWGCGPGLPRLPAETYVAGPAARVD
jgi:gamma-glutamylcyclotransferase (GGCT)/AIG2-like uncharacterized protein YtfP